MAIIPRDLIPHLRYAWYLVRHKWHVIIAGVRLGVPLWRLLSHDWSKFMPDEWGPFIAWLYGERSEPNRVAFRAACRRHYRRNPHHWQHWITADARSDRFVDPMPELFVREMVADWIGASKAQGNGPVARWWSENCPGIELAYRERVLVGQLVEKASKEGIG